MSNVVRNKFAGLLRGLLRRNDPDKIRAEEAAAAMSANAPDHGYESGDASAAANGSEAAAVGAHTTEPVGNNEIALPLAPVIASLPLDLRAKIMAVPPADTTINLPIEMVVTQLAFGAVKITFGELRQLTNGVFANSGGELDSKQIALPLNEILSRINPTLLGRRSGNKVEVDEGINGPFSSRCNGVVFTVQPLKAPKATPKPEPTEPEPFIGRKEDPIPSSPIAFRPPAGVDLPKPPVNGGNGFNGKNGSNGNGHHLPAMPANRISTPPTPPKPAPAAPRFSAAPAPVPPTPAPVKAAAPRPEPAQPTIFASLWDLSENWPDELKDEISRSNLANANVPLTGAKVDAGLKCGRLTMTWKELRILAQPSSAASPNDGLELEVPLKVVAPLFFAAQKNRPQARKATSVSSEIPNLFFGFPQAAPAAPQPPATPRMAPKPAAPASVPLPPPTQPQPLPKAASKPLQPPAQSLHQTSQLPKPTAKPKVNNTNNGETNFFVWGDEGETPRSQESDYTPPAVPQTDFTSRRAMPKDIVAEAAKLPGVAGALVTLPDGLRVASEVIPGLNPDTLSAFIPQIYERMNQSTRELRMGVLNNIGFTVGNVPWKIFRVNSVYFATFGQAGARLPKAELARLAAELDRKKQ